jgi:hypothetical protein
MTAHNPAGVVGQHVDPVVLVPQCRGQLAHLGQVGEVADEVVCTQFCGHGSRLLAGTPDDDDPLPCLGQLPCSCCADAVTGTGDDDGSLGHKCPFV